MKNPTLTLIIALVAAVPFAVSAGPSYDYLEIGYVDFDRSGQSSRNGFGGTGVFSFGENFHVTAAFMNIDNNIVKTNGTLVALGYNMSLTSDVDFIARIGYAWRRNRPAVGTSVKDSGLAASIGVRAVMSREFDLAAAINYADTFRSRASVGVEGTYYFTEELGIFLGGDFGRGRLLRLGIRFNFEDF